MGDEDFEEKEVVEPDDMPDDKEEQTKKEALRRGWVDKDEFRGDPDRWIPADKFLKRAETELPLARAEVKRLDSKLDKALKSIENMQKLHKTSLKNQFDRLKSEHEAEIKALKGKLREAVENQDVEAFDTVQGKIDQLEKNAPEEPVVDDDTKTETQGQEDLPPEFVDWGKRNDWFFNDGMMHDTAIAIEKHIAAKTGKTGADLFDAVTDEMKKRFPENFSNPNRERNSMVDSGDSDVVSNSGGKGKSLGWKDISDPEERKQAKEACKNLVNEGIYKDEKAYLKVYHGEV